ncbi:MAG TPA: DUF2490 domain-containing protein [Gemmatimonadales bacterium]|nr:DUF2490 domain-containing protein [Gemmatimonadales bacterium]
MTRLLGAAALLATLAGPAAAQAAPTYDRYSLLWLAWFGDHRVAPGLAVVGDAQLRTVDFGGEMQQLLLRAGVLADVGPGVRAGGGYAYVRSYDYGEFTPDGEVPEHRLWQQLNLSHRSNQVAFLHRFRLEQRWLDLPNDADEDDWQFQWRVRYLFRTTVPLAGSPDTRGHLYGIAADEVFIKFGASQPTNLLDQNRLNLGLGVALAKTVKLEVTYFNLQLLRGDGSRREVGNGLAVGLVSTGSLR